MYGVGRRDLTEKLKEAVVELPDEILIEILFRLPVKSLSKFKIVCKSWYSIINSKQFVERQLNHAQSSLYDQHKNVLGLLIPSWKGSNRCILYHQNTDGIMYAKQFSNFPFKLVEVCNYCDGLICFQLSRHDDDILVWNPSLLTEYKRIQMEYKSGEIWVGMGYDSTTHDYKVVRVPGCSGTERFVEVFSLKSSSWSKREIPKDITYRIGRKMSI